MSQGLKTETVMRDPVGLVPHPRNTRKHSAEQIEQIRGSIRQFGFVKPVLVDEVATVLAGHGAREAAIAEGLEEIPVTVVHGLDDAQKRAYVIADNRIAEHSTWDWSLLAEELAELAPVIDLADLGFEEWDPDAAVLGSQPGNKELNDNDLAARHRCPECGHEFD